MEPKKFPPKVVRMALTERCPTCGAMPDHPCMTSAGIFKPEPHSQRVRISDARPARFGLNEESYG
jgi:hypothetical protein